MNTRGRRLWAMIRKEGLQIVRDPSSISIAFVMPVVLLLLFGYGVSLDARSIPIGIVVAKPDTVTQSLAGAFERSEFFAPQHYGSIQQAREALVDRRIDAILWLRNDFNERLLRGDEAPMGVFVNGVDSNQANIVQGYIRGAWLSWLQHLFEARGRALRLPVVLEQRIWFNPAVSSRLFLVPGLIAIIMTMIGSLLTAMVVAREWERGTMEALMVTPLRMAEMLAGKLIPYFLLGMGGMLLSVGMALFLFAVPLRSPFWVLLASSALFMLLSLAIGLLISIVTRNQFLAGQVALVVSFLPSFLLSGFLFDIHSMPHWVQTITYLVPARYFVAILQTLFLAGPVQPVLVSNGAVMLLMLALLTLMVFRVARKRLD